jgi:hypothetical protein
LVSNTSNLVSISSKDVLQIHRDLNLRQGQVVRGTVLEANKDTIKLRIGTATIKAETRVPLKSNVDLNFLVESTKEGIIKLKILPDGKNIKPETILLSKLGIIPNNNLENILSQLVKFKLPVSGQLIGEFNNFINSHNLPLESTSLIAWLKSMGVKVETLEDVEELKKIIKLFKGLSSTEENGKFFNFLNKSENTVLGGYNVFGWPLGDNQLYLLTTGSKDDEILSSNCTLALKIISKHLGELWFKLNYTDNNLKVFIFCSNDNSQEIIVKEVNNLQNTLKSTGYNIGEISVEVKEINNVFDFIPAEAGNIAGINYKV